MFDVGSLVALATMVTESHPGLFAHVRFGLLQGAVVVAAGATGLLLSRLRDLSRVGRKDHDAVPEGVRRQRGALARPFAAAVLASLAMAPHAHADTDVTPAATLLLPYFEAELPATAGGAVQGTTTWLTITNSVDDDIAVRVVVWSDLAVPVYGFNVGLKPFDMQRIDMQQVLTGKIPQTADPGVKGCAAFLPPPLPNAGTVAGLQALLTGKPSRGECAGFDYGDRIARGYVTVDVVNGCTDKATNPTEDGYFAAGGKGVASNRNALTGSGLIINPLKKSSYAFPVAHVEVPLNEIPAGFQTFYGRYVGKTAIDGRERLGSSFTVPYYVGAANPLAPRASSIFAWRDTQWPTASPFPCATKPPWYPLPVAQIVALDDDGNLDGPPALLPASPLPLATQRVRLGGQEIPLPFDEGWLFMNLDLTEPKLEEPQSFVTILYRSRGSGRTAVPAARFLIPK